MLVVDDAHDALDQAVGRLEPVDIDIAEHRAARERDRGDAR